MDTRPADLDEPREPSPRRLPTAAWIGIAVVIVVVAAVAYVAAGRIGPGPTTASSSRNGSNPLLGTAPPIEKSLPDIRLQRFDGGSVSLAAAGDGHPMVVNLWSAQCAPCVSEMPDLEKVFHAYAGRVAFLGVDSQEAEAAGKPLARATGVTYPLASDPTAKVLGWVHSLGLPTTIVVAADGKVAQVHVGRINPAQLRGWLDQALG
jgi:thiol-disulfide isomerase/thioredoxin